MVWSMNLLHKELRLSIVGACLVLVAFVLAACSDATKSNLSQEEESPSPTTSALPLPSLTAPPRPTTTRTATPPELRTRFGATSCSSTQVLGPTGSSAGYPEFVPLAYLPDEDLADVVQQSLGDQVEHFGVFVKDLADGRGAMVNADRVFNTASLYKVWVMLEFHHQLESGMIGLGEEYLVTQYYAGLGLNSGELAPCSVVTASLWGR